jgi:hypothetical protein
MAQHPPGQVAEDLDARVGRAHRMPAFDHQIRDVDSGGIENHHPACPRGYGRASAAVRTDHDGPGGTPGLSWADLDLAGIPVASLQEKPVAGP